MQEREGGGEQVSGLERKGLLHAPIPETSISFFADFWVRVTSRARGSVSVGFWGSRQLSPLCGGGLARGLYRPPRCPIESPPSQGQNLKVLAPVFQYLGHHLAHPKSSRAGPHSATASRHI